MKKQTHHFSGMATVYEEECSDGRVIDPKAFKHQDSLRVPLVWRHLHDSMDNVVGHGILKHVDTGMRIFARFNDTKPGRQARELVRNGDIDALSVWANKIKQEAERVVHGYIREVSLVLSGANPKAKIDDVILHSDDTFNEGIIIHSGENITVIVEEEEPVKHENDDETVGDIMESMTDNQKALVAVMIHSASSKGETLTTEPNGDENTPSVSDIWSTFSEKQKNVVYYLLGTVEEDDTVEHTQEKDDETMTHNIFESKEDPKETLTHEQSGEILGAAVSGKTTSLKETVIAHAGTYGIDNLDILFPEAVNVNGNEPVLYGREMAWVTSVMSGARKSPFSRIKSAYANIQADEARAKGYITAAEKFEEVFPLFQRVTTPQTVYKKQKLDRDDILDITSFDIVMWLKKEMKVMLKEELARAVLIGDGRLVTDEDRINPANIRPIYGDDVLYAHNHVFAVADDVLDIIDGITEQREHYKGSGNPTLFLSPGTLAQMLLIRDTTNRRIYETEASLKASLRVSEIVEVPVMTGVVRDGVTNVQNLVAILVNMSDYVIGADKGGQTTFFDDFDIDFNQYKYLYETRVSGALTLPKSAIVFEQDSGTPI